MGRAAVTEPQQTVETGARMAIRRSRDCFAEHALHKAIGCLGYISFSLVQILLQSYCRAQNVGYIGRSGLEFGSV